MAWPTVTAADVANRWRPLSVAEETVATNRIVDAEAELQMRLRAFDVLEAPAGDELWATLYTSIVADMVIRYLRNPDGWVEETEAIDDYRTTRRRGTNTAPGAIFVTDDELRKLLPDARQPRGAFSIKLGAS